VTTVEIKALLRGRLARTGHVSLSSSHGHDVCIWSGNRLRARFWQGRTKHFQDQTPEFKRWCDEGCRGDFFP
jgi:hypothetical protein